MWSESWNNGDGLSDAENPYFKEVAPHNAFAFADSRKSPDRYLETEPQ
jgi:hypothetical protein